MTGLFDSGHAVDIVLIIIGLEFAWLVRRAEWHPIDAALRLLPGALILIALRCALTGSDWQWIALPLLLSFPVHIADLRRPGRENGRAAD